MVNIFKKIVSFFVFIKSKIKIFGVKTSLVMKIVWNNIKTFFTNIGKWFRNVWLGLTQFIKRIFKKKDSGKSKADLEKILREKLSKNGIFKLANIEQLSICFDETKTFVDVINSRLLAQMSLMANTVQSGSIINIQSALEPLFNYFCSVRVNETPDNKDIFEHNIVVLVSKSETFIKTECIDKYPTKEKINTILKSIVNIQEELHTQILKNERLIRTNETSTAISLVDRAASKGNTFCSFVSKIVDLFNTINDIITEFYA